MSNDAQKAKILEKELCCIIKRNQSMKLLQLLITHAIKYEQTVLKSK